MHDHTTGVTAMATRTAPGLTSHDRRIIARARELAAVCGEDALGAYVGAGHPDLIYPAAFGAATPLLVELADRLEELGGDGA